MKFTKNVILGLESLRKKQIMKFFLLFIIIIVVFLIVKLSNIPLSIAGYVFGALIMIDLITLFTGGSKYNKVFKDKVIKTFVKEYNESFEYYPKRGINSRAYVDAEFERFDNYYSEDYIVGAIDEKLKLEIAEVKTEEESTDNEGNTTTTTVFHGLFAIAEAPKFFSGKTKIRGNAIIKLFEGKQKVEMDSSEFEKYFDVNSTNKIETMQILTADVMEKLIDFREKNKIKFEITLKGNKIYIRFWCGEMFEANLFKKSLDFDTLLKYYKMINFACDISKDLIKTVKETEI